MGDKLVNVRIRARDETKPGLAKTKQNFRATAQTIKKQASGMISEETGRAMSAFNEKTEKGRQLLTAFGGAVGGAAGNVVYYTGTLSYVIGRFSTMELVVMGVIAAIGSLAYVMTRQTKEERAWAESAKIHKDLLDDIKKKTKDLAREEKYRMLGLENQRQKSEYDLYEHLKNLRIERKAYSEAIKEMADDMTAAELRKRIMERKTIDDRIRVSQKAYDELRAQGKSYFDWEVRQADLENRMAEAAAAAKEGKRAAGKKPGEREDLNIAKMMEEEERSYAEWLSLKQHAYDTAYALESQYYNQSQAMAETNANRREHILKSQLAREEHARKVALKKEMAIEKAKQEVYSNSVSMFETLGSMVAQSEEQQTAVKIAAIIARSVPKVIEETAAGFSAMAGGNFWSAAQYFTSAGLYASIAGMNVANAASGGSSGGGYSQGSGGGYGAPSESREKRDREQIIIIQLGGHKIGQVINKLNEQGERERYPGRRSKVWS